MASWKDCAPVTYSRSVVECDGPCTDTHSIGNGKIGLYGKGADIFDLFGPYYSAPPLLQLTLQTPGRLRAGRIQGAAIWDAMLNDTACWRDFTVSGRPAFMRSLQADTPVAWRLRRRAVEAFRPIPDSLLAGTRYTLGFCSSVPAGTLLYVHSRQPDGREEGYPLTERLFVLVAVSGDAQAGGCTGDEAAFTLSQGDILIVCGRDEDVAWREFEQIAPRDAVSLYRETLADWQEFTARRSRNLPPLDETAAQAADDIAVLLKAQQDAGGGILAGCNYHLSYVRDNYGDFRGLMACGCREEAKALLLYYAEVFARYGRIANAQGMGAYAFHVHENDHTEITGYLGLMAMEYYAATGDEQTLRALSPLLRWALAAQRSELKDGMLPFNGDETYIAGGILPRVHIVDGSMEATLLYHRALELYLPAAERLGLETQAFLREQREAMQTIADRFLYHFVQDGVLYCNAPGFYTQAAAPARRGGVRECGHGFGLSYKNRHMRYVCLDCLDRDEPGPAEPRRWNLVSTAFMPLWIGSELVPREILQQMVRSVCRAWLETGRLPSSPDGDCTVGYDYGLLLFAIRHSGVEEPEAYDTLRAAMLAVRDQTGAWVEYYRSGVPSGTPCRPWESGVNIAALLDAEN